jgi:hypothetical protein
VPSVALVHAEVLSLGEQLWHESDGLTVPLP